MARLSDIIESFIKDALQESDDNWLEIQRNELANYFNCAPSQINYVLTTRFTVDRGYYIESKRGGGGCIKITRMSMNKGDSIKEAIWNSISSNLTQQEAEEYIYIFLERGLISERESIIMKAAVSDKTLMLPQGIREETRAQILKTMLIALIK